MLGSICRLFCDNSTWDKEMDNSSSTSTTAPLDKQDEGELFSTLSTAGDAPISFVESCTSCQRTLQLVEHRRKSKQQMENDKCKSAEEKAFAEVRSTEVHYSDRNIALGLISACTSNHSGSDVSL